MSVKFNCCVRNINSECAIFKFNFSASCLGALYLGSKFHQLRKFNEGGHLCGIKVFQSSLLLNAMCTSIYISLGFGSPL